MGCAGSCPSFVPSRGEVSAGRMRMGAPGEMDIFVGTGTAVWAWLHLLDNKTLGLCAWPSVWKDTF